MWKQKRFNKLAREEWISSCFSLIKKMSVSLYPNCLLSIAGLDFAVSQDDAQKVKQRLQQNKQL